MKEHTEMSAHHRLDDAVMGFLDLSEDLVSLVQYENIVLLENGKLNLESYVIRKVELIGSFEKQARNLLDMLSDEQDNKMKVRNILIEEIRKVRNALKTNSGHQLQLLRERARQNMAKGNVSCH